MLAGSRDSVPGRRPQTAKPAYRWIVYPTPLNITESRKASTPPTGEGEKVAASSKSIKVFGQAFLKRLVGSRGKAPCRRPQTAKRPAPFFWRAGKGVRKSDSFFEGKRTRPLPLVPAMQFVSLENVPVEHFQRKKGMLLP